MPLPPQGELEGKPRACSLLVDEHGQFVARYDKLHLFDVDVSDSRGGAGRPAARPKRGSRRALALRNGGHPWEGPRKIQAKLASSAYTESASSYHF